MFPIPDKFVEFAFPDISFGDKRLDKRFGKVADAMLSHPEAALPDKFLKPCDYFAALDLLNHPAVTHDELLGTHQIALLNRLETEGPQVVLFLHDTTDLDFSGHKTLLGDLGQIGNGGGRGWLCHNSLAVDIDSCLIFGLAHQILHVRPFVAKKESVAVKRDRANRESRLWLQAIDAIGPAPKDKLWVHVADRGADTFELLQALHDRGRHYVIRSSHNRALVIQAQPDGRLQLDQGDGADPGDEAKTVGSEPEPHLLHDKLRTLPSRATWAVKVGATSKRQARTAMVQASYCQVELKPPHVCKGNYRKEAVLLWAVRVWEVNPPTGEEEPLEWILLTDQEISDAQRLRRVVGWYERRPVIEEFHKGQKSGVGIEKLQLQDAQSVQAAIALMSVVALALVNLRVAARDTEQASRAAGEIVPKLWVKVLSIWRYKENRPMTVQEFTLALARLGGHLNRKSDGLPGWITLWRGWERLQTMLDYELSRATCHEL